MGSYTDTVRDLILHSSTPMTVDRAQQVLSSLAEECDRYEKKWREVLVAEQAMSGAYVQLRCMIPYALHTPSTPIDANGNYPLTFIFYWTEACLREYVHEHDALEAYPADMARETLGWE